MNDWEDMRMFLLSAFFLICIGWLGGWIHAHQTVATECVKLGRFYVGDKVFHCQLVKEDNP